MDRDYVSAKEAAALLGVSVPTLYVYVGRKGLRSQPVPGSRERRYFRPDLERVRRARDVRNPAPRGEVKRESALTLITDRGPCYRGRSAVELAETATLEEVAALLWGCRTQEVFGDAPPPAPVGFAELDMLLRSDGSIDRATALFHLLERANPKAYDLTPPGMARTGADILRWLTAIVLRRPQADGAPLHTMIAQGPSYAKSKLSCDEVVKADLIRRLLVLAADHGFEPAAYAVRAVASTGVSPWRSVAAGLLVVTGRRSGFGRFDAVRRFLEEVLDSSDPSAPVVRRLRDGETLPGFGSPIYGVRDPRAQALLGACGRQLGDSPAFRRFSIASDLVGETTGLGPDFALASMFVGQEVGLDSRDSPFLIGRAAGWIAHAIEQFEAGESEHQEGVYRGLLPSLGT